MAAVRIAEPVRRPAGRGFDAHDLGFEHSENPRVNMLRSYRIYRRRRRRRGIWTWQPLYIDLRTISNHSPPMGEGGTCSPPNFMVVDLIISIMLYINKNNVFYSVRCLLGNTPFRQRRCWRRRVVWRTAINFAKKHPDSMFRLVSRPSRIRGRTLFQNFCTSVPTYGFISRKVRVFCQHQPLLFAHWRQTQDERAKLCSLVCWCSKNVSF